MFDNQYHLGLVGCVQLSILLLYVCAFAVYFSKFSVTGSSKRCPVSSAHPRGARSNRPTDRGSHPGCTDRGEVALCSASSVLLCKHTFPCLIQLIHSELKRSREET